ncbi:hypothetical protein FG05_35161 [Fusarium graminearum]|nr:hypothetical protein FG05_35161 [Fusarium graminearum]
MYWLCFCASRVGSCWPSHTLSNESHDLGQYACNNVS